MSETKRDYEVGRGKSPLHSRFKKGQSGNPRGPRPKDSPALLVHATLLRWPRKTPASGEHKGARQGYSASGTRGGFATACE